VLYRDKNETVNVQFWALRNTYFRDIRSKKGCVGSRGDDGQYKTKRRSCMSESHRRKSLDFECTKVPDVAAKSVHH
jgi:hypothetical protein